MTRQEKQKLEKHIRERIAKLNKDIISYKELAKPVSPDNAIGRITRMEAINSKSMNEASLNKSKFALTKLEQILKTINNPDFGLCYECDELIPFARLMIMPESELCVTCAEKIE